MALKASLYGRAITYHNNPLSEKLVAFEHLQGLAKQATTAAAIRTTIRILIAPSTLDQTGQVLLLVLSHLSLYTKSPFPVLWD